MQRSTKEGWLAGAGDLREAEVEDVPMPGMSVKVRSLPAAYSAAVQSQLKLEQQGREQVAKIDVAAMERLQFLHGVVEPSFDEQEVILLQQKWGAAFRKVIAKIDEISGIDKEAIANAEQRFPAGGSEEGPGSVVGDGPAAGNGRSDIPASAGVEA